MGRAKKLVITNQKQPTLRRDVNELAAREEDGQKEKKIGLRLELTGGTPRDAVTRGHDRVLTPSRPIHRSHGAHAKVGSRAIDNNNNNNNSIIIIISLGLGLSLVNIAAEASGALAAAAL